MNKFAEVYTKLITEDAKQANGDLILERYISKDEYATKGNEDQEGISTSIYKFSNIADKRLFINEFDNFVEIKLVQAPVEAWRGKLLDYYLFGGPGGIPFEQIGYIEFKV